MTLQYDKETDSLVIIFRGGEVDDTEEIRPGIIADFDETGAMVSLEILNASKKIESLNEVTYNSRVLQTS
jgi:uncharacterized protein YuzE